MIHLPALPGSPRHHQTIGAITDAAIRDAEILSQAGFDAVMIENYGDVPFTAETLDPAAIAALSIVSARVREAVEIPVGVNALRNDARSAMGIAAAAGADFIRVNVHTGVVATDQGMIEGRAHDTLRYRRRLGVEVGVFADVHVKHGTPISQPDLALAARDTAYRGLADVLIVTGPATGQPVDLDRVQQVKRAVPDRPVLVGSGATADTIRAILAVCDGVIVGTHLKQGAVGWSAPCWTPAARAAGFIRRGAPGRTSIQPPVDRDRARAFIDAARG